jgi:hypothetical protein
VSLTFGKLGVATKTYYVQKTGFPFYDACQLVGAMHLFFGTGASSLQDKNAYWQLSGPVTSTNMANYGERLKGKGLERIEQTTLVYLNGLETILPSIQEYFEALPPKAEVIKKSNQEGVSRYLEPAWLTGAKGKDGALYGVLASQRGVSSDRPESELLVATLGLTQVALAYGNDEVTTVLPLLENSVQPLQPFIVHKQRYQHSAGGAISAVFASLGILVDLGLKYQIRDFAYAYHGGRGFYYSGLLGLHRLCTQFGQVQDFARQALNYFERTRSTDPGISMDLARLLASFLKNPSLDTLTAIVRTKARILANEEDIPAWIRSVTTELLGTTQSIKEAQQMADVRQNVPPPSENLVKALGEVLFAEGKGAWIGMYIQLERADKPAKFYDEVQKILSRAISRGEKSEEPRIKGMTNRVKQSLSLLTPDAVLTAMQPENQNLFQAHKNTFLLLVLSNMRYQGPEKAQAQGDE